MKKVVFLGAVLFLLGSELIDKETTAYAKYGIWDFLMRRSNPDAVRGDAKEKPMSSNMTEGTEARSSDLNSAENHPHQIASEESSVPPPQSVTVPSDDVPTESDKIIESPRITESNTEEENPVTIFLKKSPHEVFLSSFHAVSSADELLKDITSNVESLTSGRMSVDDRNKLTRNKKIIDAAELQFLKARTAYDKISAVEKILMAYNEVCEVSAYFLPDISRETVNKVQDALVSSEIGSLKEELVYAFKTEISDGTELALRQLHDALGTYKLQEFSEHLLQEIRAIPSELLEPSQYEKVQRVTEKISASVSGDFREKCAALAMMAESYNEIKTIPFRLGKITPDGLRQLILKTVEEVLFDRMLNTLQIMSDEGYSDQAEDDEEVLAARNIRKALFFLLGGVSSSGTEMKGSIEQFRSSDLLKDKQMLLKDSVSKFNKAVKLFKNAATVLRAKGRFTKIKNPDEISTIDENIDKIFEKIAVYDNSERANAANVPTANIEEDRDMDRSQMFTANVPVSNVEECDSAPTDVSESFTEVNSAPMDSSESSAGLSTEERAELSAKQIDDPNLQNMPEDTQTETIPNTSASELATTPEASHDTETSYPTVEMSANEEIPSPTIEANTNAKTENPSATEEVFNNSDSTDTILESQNTTGLQNSKNISPTEETFMDSDVFPEEAKVTESYATEIEESTSTDTLSTDHNNP